MGKIKDCAVFGLGFNPFGQHHRAEVCCGPRDTLRHGAALGFSNGNDMFIEMNQLPPIQHLSEDFSKYLEEFKVGIVPDAELARELGAYALELTAKTIAVLGTPVHRPYPAENKELYSRIVSNCFKWSGYLNDHLSWLCEVKSRDGFAVSISVFEIVSRNIGMVRCYDEKKDRKERSFNHPFLGCRISHFRGKHWRRWRRSDLL